MEFAKRTNLGSLVAAVLVGLLSLTINQVFKSDPEAVAKLLRQFRRAPVPKQVESRPASPPERSFAEIIASLQRTERQTGRAYQRWKSSTNTPFSTLGALVTLAQQEMEELDQLDDIGIQQLRQAQILALSVYFMASEMDRVRFSRLFMNYSQQLLDLELSDSHRRNVILLRFYHEYQVKQAGSETLLRKLLDFSKAHPHANLGVPLYLVVAEDLAEQGKTQLARAVLSQGKTVYRGQAGVHRLVDRLIDVRSRGF